MTSKLYTIFIQKPPRVIIFCKKNQNKLYTDKINRYNLKHTQFKEGCTSKNKQKDKYT